MSGGFAARGSISAPFSSEASILVLTKAERLGRSFHAKLIIGILIGKIDADTVSMKELVPHQFLIVT